MKPTAASPFNAHSARVGEEAGSWYSELEARHVAAGYDWIAPEPRSFRPEPRRIA